MNVALQINRSEINDKFGHRWSFHLHVSQSKECFWRLAQTNKQTRKKERASLWGGAKEVLVKFPGRKTKKNTRTGSDQNQKWSKPEMTVTGNDRNRK